MEDDTHMCEEGAHIQPKKNLKKIFLPEQAEHVGMFFFKEGDFVRQYNLIKIQYRKLVISNTKE